MDMQLVEARAELDDALTLFTAAADAIEDAQPGADTDKLQRDFSRAEANFNTAKGAYRKQQARFERHRELMGSSTANGRASVSVSSEPLTYDRNNGNSLFRDLVYSGRGDLQAARRLDRHKREMEIERPQASEFALSSTDAAGGYLVPPLWLQEEFVALARAGRVTANTIGPRELPPNTDSINLPRMSTGTAVALQSDGGAVQSTDAAFDTIAADVKTVAGMQDVSLQLVDRSLPGVDEVIFTDLSKAYNVLLDSNVLTSNTANNLGLLNVSGVNSITFTQATPTVPLLYPKLADAVRQIAEGVFTPATAIFMAPRRWAWITAALDTQNRPLITPEEPVVNATGNANAPIAQGLVGSIQGVNIYTDPNIPTNLGGGTNEDRIIVVAAPELYLWEAIEGPFLMVFPDVLSGNLQVRFRLHNYFAQLFSRRPKAISVISGTGLAGVTF
jgi:HK97 family phage major capsid protein